MPHSPPSTPIYLEPSIKSALNRVICDIQENLIHLYGAPFSISDVRDHWGVEEWVVNWAISRIIFCSRVSDTPLHIIKSSKQDHLQIVPEHTRMRM